VLTKSNKANDTHEIRRIILELLQAING
jgi:hypothetical protein